jgi:hypothetical protein
LLKPYLVLGSSEGTHYVIQKESAFVWDDWNAQVRKDGDVARFHRQKEPFIAESLQCFQ